ncbi:CaiB/BaiF CoA-transferase family protein [Nocardioides sp. BP30]|uniref:CaiB/BaiF CoA transferase family protein n=1 Tax=Nocardioides sp. BP30 TaxID=3036374 RepID=UPI0024697BDE|nr:CaiB/BaiF CoA-transferase family protein [Nocardioides sp. BP30]WGL53092.1 CaiB/BaiF CoA-transferase family protein [Nocardioides sp. BP30]
MTGPLAGLRVIEFAGIGPGPYACLLLAELGAEVIRVDRPKAGGLDTAALNRSRPNIAVDLKTPAGLEVVLRLIDDADVVVEGLRPGVMERLGLGPDACLERNPRLVYGRMTGWGQRGPLAERAGHDITYAALSGALHATGSAGKPRNAVNLVADFGGGTLFLVMGILAAIFERGVSGRGQVVDAAMVDGATSLMTMVYGMKADGMWQDRREANLLDGGAPFYDTYECADGKHVAVGALEHQFFAELMEGTGLEFDQFDIARWPQMRAALIETFRSRTRDEWAQVFDPTDACVAPVLSLEEAPAHPHNLARGLFAPYGGGQVPRIAPVFSRTPALPPGEVHVAGQDTRAVLRAAGFAEAEVEALLEQGAVTQA